MLETEYAAGVAKTARPVTLPTSVPMRRVGTRSRTIASSTRLLIALAAIPCAIPGILAGAPGGITAAFAQTPSAFAPAGAHPADVEFLHAMIQHHAQALAMTELVEAHGASSRIRTLAERIRVSQTDEIRFMQLWLADMGETVPEPPPSSSWYSAEGHAHHMGGMLSPEQFRRLAAARGAEFDLLFLEFMIQHHEGALDMVDALFATDGGGVDDTIYKIASDTFADQGSEIDRMQRLLDDMIGTR